MGSIKQAEPCESDVVLRSLSSLAHDLNNSFAVIIANVRFAIEDLEPNHPVLTELREVLGAAERASKLTKELAHHVVDPAWGARR